jgi:hypothetical protein
MGLSGRLQAGRRDTGFRPPAAPIRARHPVPGWWGQPGWSNDAVDAVNPVASVGPFITQDVQHPFIQVDAFNHGSNADPIDEPPAGINTNEDCLNPLTRPTSNKSAAEAFGGTSMQIAERNRRLASHPLALVLTISCAHTAAFADVAVPPELRGWEEWALQGHETHRCPWLVPGRPTDDARICAWPSVLDLQADEHGGRFSQRWEAAAETWVALPGSPENWPEDVTLDGAAAAVIAHAGEPAVRVAAGLHTLTGVFRWTRRPELLALPSGVALVSLSINGGRVVNPQRSDVGIILGAHAVARQDDRADVRVFRQLDDALPALLTTVVHLAVAGEAREIRLPAALPQGFVPISIESGLAARLDPDNTLRVQVRPGEFDITLKARGPSPVTEVSLGERSPPWPREEVWSFNPEDRLRVASVEGVVTVDPVQANVPGDWRALPAYRVTPDSTLRVIERSRGLSTADGNDLQLQRTAWLDFTGKGYTIVDNVGGAMRQQWRLDLTDPFTLRSARTTSGESLLITAGMAPGLTGVELRGATVDLTAVSRLERAGGLLPATGWRTRFTSVSGRLVMAPGYRLLAALGPDSAPQAWLERWRLLDIFVVLLTATVAWRMLGVRGAVIALVAGLLTYQEIGAPARLWLAVLVALALQRAAPEGRLRASATAARALVLVLLLLVLVPFAVWQVRLAVYPQLEAISTGSLTGGIAGLAAAAPRIRVNVAVEEAKREHDFAAVAGFVTQNGAVSSPPSLSASAALLSAGSPNEEVVLTGARRAETTRYEPGALVQAGPGVPSWSYNVYSYSWSGAVEEKATAHFLISPPWMTRLWRLLGVGLSALFFFELIRGGLPALPQGWRVRPRGQIVAALLGVALTFGPLPTVRAQSTPAPTLIDELRTQLLAPPRCSPDCADVQAADVSITAGRLRVVLTVGALDAVGLALPGAEPNWTPDLVQVDGAGAGWVRRSPNGIRYVSVPRGRHLVQIEGPLDAIDALTLAFPARPHVIDVHVTDWDTGGVADRHLMSGALELVRKRATGTTNAASAARQEEFPPFVIVDRLFHLTHDWTVDTNIRRVAPKSAPFTVTLPLLAGEAITTSGLQVSDGNVAVGLGAGEDSQAFASILPRADQLELLAPRESAYSERWRFEVAPTWHAEFNGTPAVVPEEQTGIWIFEFYPRPGERLSVKVTRPAASPGSTLAFDSAALRTVVGKRSSDTTLELHYRSTQGGRQTLHIPADAVVTRVLSDGQPLALRPEHGELSLSALPGAHTWSVAWQSPAGVHLISRSPPVVQTAPASNLQLSLQLPPDRWVLYAFGPGVGPTILYWGELLVFIAAAWWMGRSSLTPLPARDWLLLGLGLSTFSWLVLALFAVFVALFQWRSRHPAVSERRRFNLLQLISALLAVAAILAVVAAVPQGLLAQPDMRIEPAVNAGELSWFADQASEHFPAPSVISISLWWYKLAMLAWALWLSFALTRWTRWAWQVFVRDGLWRRAPVRTPAPPAPPAAAAPQPSEA